MPHAQTSHPSSQILAAFAQGRLKPADAEVVRQHVAACDVCRQAVPSPRQETVLGVQRDTHPAAPQPVEEPALTEVPVELAQHTKYRILRLLGQGGMGAVYLAEHRLMKRQIAIKVINQMLVQNSDAVRRFMQEIEAVSQLDHTNIARAHDAEQAGALHLLVMEYVEGHSLEDVVKARGPLSATTACSCLRQAALGLQHAFEAGMTHRDLKPQNLMVTNKGVVKVLDFGLAKLAREQQGGGLTRENALMGTLDYIAPEQAEDAQKADVRADIYSLGCTLFFLLTGQPPFPNRTDVQKVLAHLNEPPPPLRALRPEAPAELEAVVARMMAKNPGQRYQTPAEVAQALTPFCKAGQKPIVAAPVAPTQPVATAQPVAPSRPAAPNEEEPATLWQGVTATTTRPSLANATAAKWKLWAACAAVLIALSVGGGLFWKSAQPTPGVVEIKIDPPDAEVLIGDKRVESSVELPEGKYRILVRKDGYRDIKKDISVRSGQTTIFSEKLDRKQGDLTLLIKTPAVTVKIDDKLQELAGAETLFKLDAGKRKIVVSKEGFDDETREIDIGDNQKHRLEIPQLSDQMATLKLQLSHAGAKVLLNGKPYEGAGPHRLPPGDCDLLVTLDGFKNYTQKLTLRKGELETHPVKLVRPMARLKVPVTPSDAKVYIDDKEYKPDQFINLQPGKYTLKGVRNGYKERSLPIEIKDGEERTEPLELAKFAIEEIARYVGHAGPVRSVAFLPPGNERVLSAGNGSADALRLWQANSAKELHRSPESTMPFSRLVVSPDGARILGTRDLPAGQVQTVELWEAANLTRIKGFPAGTSPIVGIHFLDRNASALFVSADLRVQKFNLATGTSEQLRPAIERAKEWDVKAVAFAPDGQRLVVATAKSWDRLNDKSVPNRLYLLDVNFNTPPQFLGDQKVVPLCVAFAPNGSRILSGDREKLLLWDTGKKVKNPSLGAISQEISVHCVAYLADGRHALTGGADKVVRLWDLQTRKSLQEFTSHAAAVRCLAVASDGKQVASCDDVGTVRVLRLP